VLDHIPNTEEKMGVTSQNFDIKTVATMIGVATALAGVVGTWTLMQYRLDALEEDQKALAAEVASVSEDVETKGEEVKCLICSAHEIPCPGC
jgi:hypothetical protein